MVSLRIPLLLLAAIPLLATACPGGDASPATPTATLVATGSSPPPTTEPTATRLANGTATAVPATPGPARVQVTGLFEGEPPAGSQPQPVTRRLGPSPASPFTPWDGKHAVVYDTKTGAEIDLGETFGVVFSPDSAVVAWVAVDIPGRAGVATAMTLATGERRTYGEGTNVGFVDARKLAVHQDAPSKWALFDLDTGRPSSDQSIPPDLEQRGLRSYPPAPAGFYWETTPDPSTALERGWAGRNKFRLIEIASGAAALQFDAVLAAPGGPGEIVLGTPLQGVETNIFVVNIQSGKAEFIARTRYGRGPNWPLSATAGYVVWTDNFCRKEGDDQQGHIQVYDRRAKTLTDIDDSAILRDAEEPYVRLTPGNLLARGSFGAFALIDPVSLVYKVVAPAGSPGFRNWSPDYRYLGYAPTGGHGGLC
jgi:hypothetical protein